MLSEGFLGGFLFASFQLPMVASNPWHPLAGRCMTPFSDFICTWHSSCDSVSKFHSYIPIPVIGVGPTIIKYDLILTLLYLQRPHFKIRLHLQVQVFRDSTYLLVAGGACHATHSKSPLVQGHSPSQRRLHPSGIPMGPQPCLGGGISKGHPSSRDPGWPGDQLMLPARVCKFNSPSAQTCFLLERLPPKTLRVLHFCLRN